MTAPLTRTGRHGETLAARGRDRTRRGLLRDQRGTASIEAAVMLPIMAICWAGLMLRFDQIERYMSAATDARRDAWLYSNAGCEDEPPNKRAKLQVDCVESLGSGNNQGFGWASKIRAIPVVGFFVDTIFGFKFAAIGHVPYTEPPLFGGGTKTANYSYPMMCNEKERDGKDVLGQVLVQMIDSLGLGFGISDDVKAPNRGDTCH